MFWVMFFFEYAYTLRWMHIWRDKQACPALSGTEKGGYKLFQAETIPRTNTRTLIAPRLVPIPVPGQQGEWKVSSPYKNSRTSNLRIVYASTWSMTPVTLVTAFWRLVIRKYTIDTAIVRSIQAPIKRIAPMNVWNRI